MIEIQKNVPMPKTLGHTGRIGKYPWKDMEVGDSIYLDGDRAYMSGLASSASVRYAPKRFSSAKEGTGRRIWRIA